MSDDDVAYAGDSKAFGYRGDRKVRFWAGIDWQLSLIKAKLGNLPNTHPDRRFLEGAEQALSWVLYQGEPVIKHV